MGTDLLLCEETRDNYKLYVEMRDNYSMFLMGPDPKVITELSCT